jgi:hypothetical protein
VMEHKKKMKRNVRKFSLAEENSDEWMMHR